MPYFLSDKNLTVNRVVEISGEEARHILLAHRIKKGEKIKLQGPDAKRYKVEIKEMDRNKLMCLVLELIDVPPESSVKITLFQSHVSEKALDFIFQKGTELGLNKIVLFNSKNTAAKLPADKFKAKQERWNKILIESAKQSERAKWPELEFVSNVDEVLSSAKSLDKVFLTDTGGEKLNVKGSAFAEASADRQMSNVAILVGPEGGFTEAEVAKFKSLSNLQTISLGPILLRAETAAIASLAIIKNFIG